MSGIIHARLDARTRQIMRQLKRRYGWNDSEIVRQAIRAFGEAELTSRERSERIVGLGKFASGLPDLGSNKGHLRDFGR